METDTAPPAVTTEQFQLKHWITDAVLFQCEVDAGLSLGQKRGIAVRAAIKVGARLDGARLDGARLDRARLVGASLVGASGAISIGQPNGRHIVIVRHDDGIRIAAGCRWFTFRAAIEHWRGRDDRAETRAALDYIRALCAIRGWPLGEE